MFGKRSELRHSFNEVYKDAQKLGNLAKSSLNKLYSWQQRHGQQAVSTANILADLHDRRLISAAYRTLTFPGTRKYGTYQYKQRYRKKDWIKPSRRYAYRQYYRQGRAHYFKRRSYRSQSKRVPYKLWIKRHKGSYRGYTKRNYGSFY